MAVVAVAVGACAQAMTGIGFALICAPLLILCVDATQAVILVSAFSIILNLMVLAREWRYTNLRHAVTLFIPACLVAPLAGYVAGVAPSSTLSTIGGVSVLLAVAVLASGVRSAFLAGRMGTILSGGISGLMGTLAGLGGPAVAAYAMNAEWDVKMLRPTLNLYFIALNLLTLAVRGGPSVEVDFGIGLAVAVVVGFGLGASLVRRFDHSAIRRLILVLAAVGGVAATAKGLV